MAVREGILSLLQRIILTDQTKTVKEREDILSSSLSCLQLLVLGSGTVRNVMMSNHQFMFTLFRGMTIFNGIILAIIVYIITVSKKYFILLKCLTTSIYSLSSLSFIHIQVYQVSSITGHSTNSIFSYSPVQSFSSSQCHKDEYLIPSTVRERERERDVVTICK